MNQRRHVAQRSDQPHLGGAGGRGVLLLAVAVVIGIVVLQAADDTQPDVSVTTGTTANTTTETTVPTATTARALRAPAEVKVLPANGTRISGLATRVADMLKQAGYTNTLAATDATTNTAEVSVIQFTPDFAPEALAVATVLGLPATSVKALDTPPVRDTRGADVIVLAGADLNRTASSVPPTTPTTTA